jgi:hypothetical protein
VPNPPSPCASPARLERAVEIYPRGTHCGRESEDNASDDGDAQCEGQHGTVDGDRVEARDVPWVHRPDDVETGLGDQQACAATQQAEHDAFRQQLPQQPLPARAERRADRHFLLTAGGACEQQVGDVRARDQQNQGNRSEEYQDGPTHVADDLFEQWNHADRERSVALVLLANARGDHADVRLRFGHRHAWLQAPHQVVVLVISPRHSVRAEREGQEEVHGDLCERYSSPWQYLSDAAATILLVLWSQVRRTSDGRLVLAEASALALSFLSGAGQFENPSFFSGTAAWLCLSVPCFVALGAIVLRDAYANRESRSPLATAFDAIPAVVIALMLETALAIARSDLALPRLVTTAGSGRRLHKSRSRTDCERHADSVTRSATSTARTPSNGERCTESG